MKRLALKILLLLLLAVPCRAQVTSLSINSGVLVTTDITRDKSFRVLLNQNVRSVVLNTSAGPTAGTEVQFMFIQDATGGRSVSGWSYPGGSITSACAVSQAH